MACERREPGWYRAPEALQTEKHIHGTFQAIADAHGGDGSTYQKWWHRHGFQSLPHGPKPNGGEEELSLDADRLADIDRLLRERGLDPAEWVVIRCVVNTWGPVDEQLKQLKVTLRPRLDAILRPAETNVRNVRPIKRGKADTEKSGKHQPVGPDPVFGSTKRKKGEEPKPRLVVFVGDEQAPYHDPQLHELFCVWLEKNKPDEAVHLGDLMDLPTLSRHRTNPVWNASPQECIQAGYDILRAYTEASPETRWAALPGNHDERLRDYQLQRAPELFGVRPADLDGRELAAAVHSLPTLLRLPELGVEWHGGSADYEHAQVDVSPELVARHGWVTGANSPDKTVRRIGLNVVVGHTHRQRVHYVTEERRRETLVTVCIEAGCMCLVEGGLGYTVNADWQNGAFAAQVWPDGSFNGEHLVYRNRVLSWRDQRYV